MSASHVGESETKVVRGDDVVRVRQRRDEMTEHERAGRTTMQQHERGCVGTPGLTIEETVTANRRVAVVDRRHGVRVGASGYIPRWLADPLVDAHRLGRLW
jgi:hypothetical protein